ncbi:MAG: phosphoenolpyruvate carboxykinase (ATP), partial [Robiginitomaculum sp.]|nr:phosphoenolpyruvate carboxykinase (ATP) [Robiginitomaculum sp.]
MGTVELIKGLSISGFEGLDNFRWNWGPARLYETAVTSGEGKVAKGGPLVVKTGKHTGRSANDKFVVRDGETENTVWWDGNASMTPAQFTVLRDDFAAQMRGKDLVAQETFGGADLDHRLSVQIITEFAWHSLFVRHLLRMPTTDELANFTAEFTIINLPSFRADPARHGTNSETVIAVNMSERLVLIGGTS